MSLLWNIVRLFLNCLGSSVLSFGFLLLTRSVRGCYVFQTFEILKIFLDVFHQKYIQSNFEIKGFQTFSKFLFILEWFLNNKSNKTLLHATKLPLFRNFETCSQSKHAASFTKETNGFHGNLLLKNNYLDQRIQHNLLTYLRRPLYFQCQDRE